jgi:dUTP pyrophosphatase
MRPSHEDTLSAEESMIDVAIAVLTHGEGLPVPAYATAGAAGADLYAAIGDAVSIGAGGWALVPCGFRIALPPGYEAQVRPRSGLAVKHGVTVLNAPGTIDSDYRGEVMVALINHGAADFVVHRGDRIAQIVIAPVAQAVFSAVVDLGSTVRGSGGFGSTGR